MTLYYVDPAGDGTDGLSLATAKTTVAAGIALCAAGDTVYISPGTYAESILVGVSGSVGAYITIQKNPNLVGEVVVDSGEVAVGDRPSGYPGTLGIFGRSYIELADLTIRNNGRQWGDVDNHTIKGVEIAGTNLGQGAGSVGSHHIRVTRCTFEDIQATKHVDSYSLPLVIYSHGDISVAGAATHHIEVRDCTFRDCDMTQSSVPIYHSFVEIAGNVENWVVSGCTFTEDSFQYSTPIQVSGNTSATANPRAPRKGVFSANRCYANDELRESLYGCYIQGATDTLIQGNLFKGYGYGVGVNTEAYQAGPGGVDNVPAARIWVRDNLIWNSWYVDIVLGAWAETYNVVNDVWVTHNTCYRDHTLSKVPGNEAALFVLDQSTGNSGLAETAAGGCRVGGNVFASPGPLLYMNLASPLSMFRTNLWVTLSDTPAFYDSGVRAAPPAGDVQVTSLPFVGRPPDTEAGFKLDPGARLVGQIRGGTPPWYTSTVFGDYQLDETTYFGETWDRPRDPGCDQADVPVYVSGYHRPRKRWGR